MPAKSKKQQMAMAIAEHEPGKLYAKNKAMLKMSQEQMHEFAATPRKGLPAKKHRMETESHQYDWRKRQGRPKY